jgi:transcriptional/translational regulatory protein YebC/TACO1
MEYNIIDIIDGEDAIEVKTEPKDFYVVKQILVDNHCEIYEGEIKLIAQNKITSLDEEAKTRIEKFIDSCEQDDDIQ